MSVIHEFETEVGGVLCLIKVTGWEPYRPARVSGPVEDCHPAEGGCGEYEICDLQGRPAPHLEDELSARQREALDAEVFDQMEHGG